MQSLAFKALARGLASSAQRALQQCQASSATLSDFLEHNVPVGSTLLIDAAANVETATSSRHDVVQLASVKPLLQKSLDLKTCLWETVFLCVIHLPEWVKPYTILTRFRKVDCCKSESTCRTWHWTVQSVRAPLYLVSGLLGSCSLFDTFESHLSFN